MCVFLQNLVNGDELTQISSDKVLVDAVTQIHLSSKFLLSIQLILQISHSAVRLENEHSERHLWF